MTQVNQTPENGSSHLLSNKFYDFLKNVALIVLPALGTLYVTLAAIWDLPAAEEVSGTVVAIVIFLGVIIKIGDMTYNNSDARFDGAMVIEHKSGGGRTFSLNLEGPPEELIGKKEIIFKVKSEERDTNQVAML